MSQRKPGDQARWEVGIRWFEVIILRTDDDYPGCWVGVVVDPGNQLEASWVGQEIIVPDEALRSPQWMS